MRDLNLECKYLGINNEASILELIDNSIVGLIDFMDEKKNKKVACCGPNLINSKGEPNLSYGNFLSRDKFDLTFF